MAANLLLLTEHWRIGALHSDGIVVLCSVHSIRNLDNHQH